ncbi:chemotaxis protein CheW [Telmatospirillum sp.]|uniref:chemotaxis protein CheW n=1 Tax=Telmatospirillum sp. TaxID=2079197 RepID=UPI00284A4AA8|nr:chemotaxis protein CheW [Telmatospirillum sp.]MDR3438055.1 chemotaxis protein CheW [Telmatospirillum sp.]
MNDSAVSHDPAQYVTIGMDREIFALPVRNVREILDMQPITRLPHAPPFMAGMIDVRGMSVPTIDLRVKLGLPAVPVTESTRIVVLDLFIDGQPRPMGIIADRVIEVTSMGDQEMEAAPDVGVRWRSDYIRAIGRVNGAFVIVFDLSRLFSSEDTALLDPSCQTS